MFLPLFLMISSVSLFLNVYAGDVPPPIYELPQDIKSRALFEIGDVIMESSERKALQEPLLYNNSFWQQLLSNQRFQELCKKQECIDVIREDMTFYFPKNNWSAFEPKDFAEVFKNDDCSISYRLISRLQRFFSKNEAFHLFLTHDKETVPLPHRVNFSSLILRKKYVDFNEFYPSSDNELVNNSFHHIFMVSISCLQHGLLLTYNECPYSALHIYMRMKKDPIILNNIMSTFLANDPIEFNKLLVKAACGCDVGERIIRQYPTFSTLLSEHFKNILIQKTSYFVLPNDSIQSANYDLKKNLQKFGNFKEKAIVNPHSYEYEFIKFYSYKVDNNNINYPLLPKWRDLSDKLLGNETRFYFAHQWLIIKAFSQEVDIEPLNSGKGKLKAIFNDIKDSRNPDREFSIKTYMRKNQKFMKKYLFCRDIIKCFFDIFSKSHWQGHGDIYIPSTPTTCCLSINQKTQQALLTDMLKNNDRYIGEYNCALLEKNLDDNAKIICTFIKLHMKYSASPADKPQFYDENSEIPRLLYKSTSNTVVHAIINAFFNIKRKDNSSFTHFLHAWVVSIWSCLINFWHHTLRYTLSEPVCTKQPEGFSIPSERFTSDTKQTIDWEKYKNFINRTFKKEGDTYEVKIKKMKAL